MSNAIITNLNTPIFNLDASEHSPLSSHLFNVILYNEDESGTVNSYDMAAIVEDMSMPSKENTIVTRWKYGKPRSFLVNYDTANGTISMRFIERATGDSKYAELMELLTIPREEEESEGTRGVFSKILIEWFYPDMKSGRLVTLYNCVVSTVSWSNTLNVQSATLSSVNVEFTYDDFNIDFDIKQRDS